jgi:hypothetical protein
MHDGNVRARSMTAHLYDVLKADSFFKEARPHGGTCRTMYHQSRMLSGRSLRMSLPGPSSEPNRQGLRTQVLDCACEVIVLIPDCVQCLRSRFTVATVSMQGGM